MSKTDIKKQIIDFIQDQQSHEVENENILNKIPNLVEYLTDQAISQSKEELMGEIKKKLKKDIMFNNNRITKTTSNWDEQDWTFYGKREALKDFLEDLNKR